MRLCLFLLPLILLGRGAKDGYCQAEYPTANAVPDGYSLQMVLSMSRHGARTPINVIDNEYEDPKSVWSCGTRHIDDLADADGKAQGGAQLSYAVPDFVPKTYTAKTLRGNCSAGQLTLLGQQQTRALGAAMREVYVDKFGFFPDVFDPAETVFTSTDVQRTRESLVSFLQGLYPLDKRGNRTITATVPLGPNPYHPPEKDVCPRLQQLYKEARKLDEYVAMRAKAGKALKKINKIMNTTGDSRWDDALTVANWKDQLRSRHCHGMPVFCDAKECLTDEEYFQIADMADYQGTHDYLVGDSPKLAIGPFMSLVHDLISKRLSTGAGPRYMHFSAHDNSILPILAGYGQHLPFPPFASSIIWEVWQDATSTAHLRVVYNGSPLTVSGCDSEMCPFETYLKHMDSKFRILDYDAECASV